MKTDTKKLVGGMDLDHDPDFIKPGDYVEAWNSTSYRGLNSLGRLFNLKGTESNGYTYGGSGVRTINGIGEDRPNNHLYYFVHSTIGADFIIQHNVQTKANVLVYTNEILAMDLSYPIQAIVVNGRLIWTDNNIGPRSLDIERAINFSAGSGTPIYTSIDTTVLDFVRRPPNEAPIPTFGQDTGRVQNNIFGKVFQFAYRYVYFDKSKSVFGPYSNVLIPVGEELSTGLLEEDSTVNNQISVDCFDGPDIVSKVELYVRELRSDEALGYWSLVKTFERGIDTIVANYYTFVFINDRGAQIDINESLRPYDYVPKLAKTLSNVDGSRIIFGNYLAGFDPITPDVTLSFTHTAFANSVGSGVFMDIEYTPEDSDNGQVPFELIHAYAIITIDSTVYIDKVYRLQLSSVVWEYTAVTGNDADHIANALIALAQADGYTNITDTSTIAEIKVDEFEEGQATLSCVVSGLPTSGTVVKEKTWKRGAFHPLGIGYRDLQGRPLSVVQNAGTRIYIPFSTEQMEAGTLVDGDSNPITHPVYKTRIDYVIEHLPPEDAATWQWVYLKNNLKFSEQYYVQEVLYITETANSRRVGFDINTALYKTQASKEKNKLVPYVWTKGDRLRVITSDGLTLLSTYLDFVIHGTYFQNEVEYVLVDHFTFSTYSLGPGTTVEIYRPDYEVRAVEDNETQTDYDEQWKLHYFELGEIYDIYDSGGTKYHRAKTQDQTGVLDATGYIDTGDAYQRVRFLMDSSIHCETGSISDYYDSSVFHKGRLMLYNPNLKETRYEHGLFHGGQDDELTDNVNKMFSFDYDGFMHDLSLNDGPIAKIVTVGDILKTFQRSKVSSIYIGRDAALTSSGDEILRTSNSVLGSIRPSIDDFGTTFPESVFVDGTTIYFYDAYSKKFLANTQAGNVDLGEKGNMARYFIDLSNDVLASTMSNIKVFIAKDRFNQIFIAIKDSTSESTLPRAITFYPEKIQFKSFHDLTAEWVAGWEKVVSFVAGTLWVHDETTNYGLIHGSQVEQTVKVCTGADPGIVKNYLTIILDTNHNERITGKTYDTAARALMWSSKTKGDLSIESTVANSDGKQTRLLPMRWERKKDHLYCDIPPDMNDPAYDTDAESIMNGRPMVGKTLFVLVRNEGTTNIDIESILINYLID